MRTDVELYLYGTAPMLKTDARRSTSTGLGDRVGAWMVGVGFDRGGGKEYLDTVFEGSGHDILLFVSDGRGG